MRWLLIIVAALVLWSADDSLRNWRLNNFHQNRYEGLITEPVSAPTFDLLSLTRYRTPELTRGSKVQLRWFQQAATTVVVVARGLRERKAYRMETIPHYVRARSWSYFTEWPTAEYLDAQSISVADLGVVGWVAPKGRIPSLDGGSVVPVDIYAQGEKPVPTNSYRALLTSNLSLVDVRGTVTARDGREVLLKMPKRTRGKVPFEITIPLAELRDRGEYTLTISGTRQAPPNDTAFVRFDLVHEFNP